LIDKNDPSGNTLFAGGVGGGLWKSTDEGITWNPINDLFTNLAVTAIAQDPNNYDIIYFGTGEGIGGSGTQRGAGIWKSTDGGNTFTQLSSTNNNLDFFFVAKMHVKNVNGSSYVFAATSSTSCNRGGIMRSINGGSSWTRFDGNFGDCINGLGVNDFASDIIESANGCLLASFGASGILGASNTDADGIYFSYNHGDTWTQAYSSYPDEGRIKLAASPTDANTIYAVVEVNESILGLNVPRILKSSVVANNLFFNYVSTPDWFDGSNCDIPKDDWCRGQDFYDLTVGVSPADPNKVMIGGIDLFQSNNGGITWTQLTNWFDTCGMEYVHADQHVILYENANEVWIGTDGGVFKSSNANSASPEFEFRGHSYNVTQFYAADLHPDAGVNEYVGGTQDNGSQHFTQPGMNSTTKVGGGDGMFSHIDQDQPNVQVTATARQLIFGTTDHWDTQSLVFGGQAGRFVNPSDYDDVLNKYYCGDLADHYMRWNNTTGGAPSFTRVFVSNFPGSYIPNNPGNDNLHGITTIRVSPSIPDRVYFGFDNGTIYYVDNASTGTNKSAVRILNFGLGQAHTISCIEIDPNDENHMIATLSNYGVESVVETYNALDPNSFWQFSEGNLPDMPVRWAMFDPNNSDRAMIATELGVWSTDNLDGSNTEWTPTNVGLANTRIDMIKYRPSDNHVIVATHGRGLYSTDDFGTCTNVLEISNELITGNQQAAQSIILNNASIFGNTTLSAPEIEINGEFTMFPNSTLQTDDEGCQD
jgi:hypothetical protein